MSQTAMCDTGAAKGIDTRFVLYPKSAREMDILGVSSGQLIGFTSEEIPYDPLDRRIAGAISGSMSYDSVQMSLYLRPHTDDQEELRMLATDQAAFNQLWLYYDRKGTEFTHFQTLDLTQEPCGTFTISGWSHQSFSRSDLKQVQFTLSVNGIVSEYDRHTQPVAWTLDDGLLTATDGDFVTNDFRVGMSVIYETGDTMSPYGYGVVDAVSASTLTLSGVTLDVDGGQGRIHGARIHL